MRLQACSPPAVFPREGTAFVTSMMVTPTLPRWRATSKRIADPERPIPVDALLSVEMSGRRAIFPTASAAKLATALAIVLGLTLAWNFTPLSEFLDSKTIEATMAEFASRTWAPAYVVGAFLIGGLVAFPLILLIAGTAAAFGPVVGFAYAAAGSLASALLTYFIGAWLGRDALENVLGPRLNRIRARIQRSGVVAVAAIRLVPIAPFTIVNMVAGASGINPSHYTIGTALGLCRGCSCYPPSAARSWISSSIRRWWDWPCWLPALPLGSCLCSVHRSCSLGCGMPSRDGQRAAHG